MSCLIETHISLSSLVFALFFLDNTLAFKELLAVLVELESDYLAIGGVDGDGGLGAIGLVLGDFVNVESPTSAIDLQHFTLLALVVAFGHTSISYLSSPPLRRPSEPVLPAHDTDSSDPSIDGSSSSSFLCATEPRSEPSCTSSSNLLHLTGQTKSLTGVRLHCYLSLTI